jgi:hypothetical protein
MIYTRALSNKVLRVPETCYLIVILPHEISNMSPEPVAGATVSEIGTAVSAAILLMMLLSRPFGVYLEVLRKWADTSVS